MAFKNFSYKSEFLNFLGFFFINSYTQKAFFVKFKSFYLKRSRNSFRTRSSASTGNGGPSRKHFNYFVIYLTWF